MENERINFDNEDYFDRSGCGPIASVLLVIVVLGVAVGGYFLFGL